MSGVTTVIVFLPKWDDPIEFRGPHEITVSDHGTLRIYAQGEKLVFSSPPGGWLSASRVDLGRSVALDAA